jgi:cytochrome P450
VTTVPSTIELPSFLRSTLGLRSRRHIPYDTAVRIRWADSAYLLTHPDDVRHVLVDNAGNYSKTRRLTGEQGRLRAGAGLLTATGEEHRRQRTLLQPLFHRRTVETFQATMLAGIGRSIERWRAGTELELGRAMSDLTMSNMLAVLFGGGGADARLMWAIDARRRHTDYVYHSRLPLRTRIPTRVVRDYRRAIRIIDDTVASEIASRRGDRTPRQDLLSMLMNVEYADGSSMNERQIRDEVLTLTSAGYETLGEALTWTSYLLALHPEIQARVCAESDTALTDDAPGPAEISKLELTESVLREALRLYPPTWIYERLAHDVDRLPSGARVNTGGTVYLCQYVMHRHPRFFENPERFDPERFVGLPQRPFRFAYFPFGDGAHTCIGETLAMLQGVSALALMNRRLRFEIVPGQTIVPRAGITLSPRYGIRVRVHVR